MFHFAIGPNFIKMDFRKNQCAINLVTTSFQISLLQEIIVRFLDFSFTKNARPHRKTSVPLFRLSRLYLPSPCISFAACERAVKKAVTLLILNMQQFMSSEQKFYLLPDSRNLQRNINA